jgi:hypothetical protein
VKKPVNKLLKRRRSLWKDESFDPIGSEEHFEAKTLDIGTNAF